MLRTLVLALMIPGLAVADTDETDEPSETDTDAGDSDWPSDTDCEADTADTDANDCDGVNDDEGDVASDGDSAGALIGETGGPACASVSVVGGFGLAGTLLALSTRRRRR